MPRLSLFGRSTILLQEPIRRVSVDSPILHLKDRIESIQRRIGEAAARSGRPASAIRLVAATKTWGAETILECARLGIRETGENRVQEAAVKRAALAKAGLTHHFIGQLQTNKARPAVELFDVIQSVDRLRLVHAIDRAASDAGKRQRCLIEVKISDDSAKGGVAPGELKTLVAAFKSCGNLVLEGLMGIGPNDADEAQTRSAFRKLSALFAEHRPAFGPEPTLSMGMSEDFELAIEEGSTMVRVGRALFGERPRQGQ
jgi:PLP dependent protein